MKILLSAVLSILMMFGVCDDSPTGPGEVYLIGDINCNELAYEIADAVLYGLYFVNGKDAFGDHPSCSVGASDINEDGKPLTVADYTCLVRIVVGDAIPYPKKNPTVAYYMTDLGVISVDSEMGAAFIIVAGNRVPTLLADNMDMKYAFDGENTRILVHSTNANNVFDGDFLAVDGKVIGVELARYDGGPVDARQFHKE